VEIRLETPSSREDCEQWARILLEVSGDLVDVDELAFVFESDRESAWLLARAGDSALGCGVGRPSSLAQSLYSMIRVLPEHRGQGVGSVLYAAISEHAQKRGDSSLWGRVLEDDAESRRFVSARGFREVSREYEVVVDTSDADVPGALPSGIELVTLAERPELEPAVYAVDLEVAPDVPGLEGAHAPWSFERWHAQYLEGPGAEPSTCVVALAGDELVGYTGLRRRGATSPVAENLLTAVRRPWRRRGIATALKREQIARARAAGIEQIYTTNDETNTGMRGVNAVLGYRSAPVQILVSGPLAPGPGEE